MANNMGLYIVLAGVAAVGAYFLFNSLKGGGGSSSGNLLSGGISGGIGAGGLNAAGNIALGDRGGPNSPAPPSDETEDASDLDSTPMNPLEEYQQREIDKIKSGCCICKTHRGDVRCVNYQTGKSKTYKNTQNVSRVRALCNKKCDDDLQDLPVMMKTASTRGMVNPTSLFATSRLHYF